MTEDIIKGGNGELKQEEKPMPGEKLTVLVIRLDKNTKQVEVEGMIGNKLLCFNVIAEAIKTIASFDPSPIIKPAPVGGMAGLSRRFFKKH